MTTIREWIHTLDNLAGYSKRRVYTNIKTQMYANKSKFGAKWWDTVVTQSDWKEMLKEALK